MNKFILRITLLSLLTLGACTTAQSPKPNLEQLVSNQASMTKTLKSLDPDLSVQILKTGVQNDKYVRIIALKLSGTPVIAAISQTNLKNPLFKDIIANADVTPIGVKLFAPNSPIKRNADMQISKVELSSIKNPILHDYIASLGYTGKDAIIKRYSQFYYQKQTLDLIEYILPSINQFTSH